MIVPAPVLPTTRDENWKHAPLRGIERLRWAPPTALTQEARLAATALLGDDPPRIAPAKRVARGTAASALDAVFDGMDGETKPVSRTATKAPEKAASPEQKDFLSMLKRSRPDVD